MGGRAPGPVRGVRRAGRRQALVAALAGVGTPVTLCPQTPDLDEARNGMEDYLQAGLEGLVIKGTDEPYVAGRIWWKYRVRWPVDLVILGVTDAPTGRPDTVSIDMETSTSG